MEKRKGIQPPTETQGPFHGVSASLISVAAEVLALQNTNQDLGNQYQQTVDKLKRANESLAVFQSGLDQVCLSKQETELELDRARKARAEIEVALEKTKSSLENERVTSIELTMNLKRVQGEWNKVLENEIALRSQIADMHATQQSLQEEAGKTRTLLFASERDLKKERETSNQLTQRHTELKALHESQEAQLVQTTQDLDILTAKHSELNKVEARQRAEKADLDQRIKYAISEVDRWHSRSFAVEVALENANKAHATLEGKIVELNAVIKGLEQKNAQTQGEVDRLAKVIQLGVIERDQLLAKNQKRVAEVADQKETISGLKKALSNRENELRKGALEHGVLVEELKASRRAIDTQRSRLGEQESGRIEVYKKKEQRAQEQIQAREEELNQLKELCVHSEEMKNALWQELREAQGLVKMHRQEIARLNTIINMGQPDHNLVPFLVERATDKISEARQKTLAEELSLEKEKQLLSRAVKPNISVLKPESAAEPEGPTLIIRSRGIEKA